MATSLQVRFESSEYEFSHGHLPRGRGSWAFTLDAGDIDVSALKGAVARYNDSPPRVGTARLECAVVGGALLLWLSPHTFSEARRLASLLVTAGAHRSTIVEVAP